MLMTFFFPFKLVNHVVPQLMCGCQGQKTGAKSSAGLKAPCDFPLELRNEGRQQAGEKDAALYGNRSS